MIHRPKTRMQATVFALAVVLTAVGLGLWFQFWRCEPLRLLSPLLPGESQGMRGTPVFLDEAQVGEIAATRDGVLELSLSVSAHQRCNLKEGLRRVVGTRAIFLTSEFLDPRGAPLIDQDVVPAITAQQRELRRWWRRMDKWLLPATGAGALLCIRWLFGRRT